MKTFIFFLALSFSLLTVMNTLANIIDTLNKLKRGRKGNNLLKEFICGMTAIIFWTYFYYLYQF